MICKKTFGENRETNLTLRASLCKNQTSWEMKTLRMRGNLLIYTKNINFSFFLERPIETSRRNTMSRHRDNVHVYDK